MLFRSHRELAFEAIELQHRVLAIASLITERNLGRPRAIFGENSCVVGGAKFFLDCLQVGGDSGHTRFFAAEE